MPEFIRPPSSLTGVLPNLRSAVEDRKKERERNLRANEVFLQARTLLDSDLAQTIDPNIPMNEGHFEGKKVPYKATPPITTTLSGNQEASLSLREGVQVLPHAEVKRGDMVIVIRIDDESLPLFTIGTKADDNWNPSLILGAHQYYVANHKGYMATYEEMDMAKETLHFMETSLREAKPQSQPEAQGGGGGGL